MKSILVVLFLSLVAQHAYSQNTLAISPTVSMEALAPTDKLTIFDIYQENKDTVPINIGWRKVSVELPPEWDYSMCELGRCYAGIPDSSQMDDLGPGEQAFLGLNISPNGTMGVGTVVCYVFDTRFPEHRDTLAWHVTTTAAGVARTKSQPTATIRPNPTESTFELHYGSDVDGDVTVFGMDGKLVGTYTMHSGELRIDLSQASEGSYLVHTHTSDGRSFTEHLVKH